MPAAARAPHFVDRGYVHTHGRVFRPAPRVLELGYSYRASAVQQELEEGLRSIAAPVRDRDGEVVAAVNIPVHAGRNSVESVRRDLLPHLPAAVARIEADRHVTGPVRASSRGSGTRR